MPCSTLSTPAPRILFLDAYDSFSNNIAALLTEQIRAYVVVVKIDDPRYLDDHAAFLELLKEFNAVLAGPGPGSPTNPRDVGLIAKLWSLPDCDVLPVLGICLGFQSLACAFGTRVKKLKEPRHGVIEHVQHDDTDIFENVGDVVTTQYHSLHIDLLEQRDCATEALYQPSAACPELEPLAWVLDELDNGPTLMAIKHRTKPFWGVQFHPESICSELKAGTNIITNWWKAAQKWSKEHRRPVQTPSRLPSAISEPEYRNPVSTTEVASHTVQWLKLPLCGLDATQVADATKSASQEIVLLESGMLANGHPVNPETGRYSILGILDADHTLHIEYRTKSHTLTTFTSISEAQESTHLPNVYQYLKHFMSRNAARDGPTRVPFWGGLIGFISYEACLDTIDIQTNTPDTGRPDMLFVHVTRSIVIDHIEGQIYIQSIQEDDHAWLETTLSKLQQAQTADDMNSAATTTYTTKPSTTATVNGPPEAAYRAKVLACQSLIREGESYELCLTDTTRIHCPPRPVQQLHKRLRRLNPAPFSAYLHFKTSDSRTADSSNTLTILSSSPERFLSWTRPQSSPSPSSFTPAIPPTPSLTHTQILQFRPIKGTLRKSPLSPMTPAQAHALLATPKERAENLMIVDLIRHDLHGVLGAGNVEVTKLMGVEEYETVWQLVSVIEGTLITGHGTKGVDGGVERDADAGEGGSVGYARSDGAQPTPIVVLAASLPPGSMTGAPKARSCQLLQQLEGAQGRGVYAGVLGYLDVGGGGDWSVLIRAAWRWGDDVEGGSAQQPDAEDHDEKGHEVDESAMVETDEKKEGKREEGRGDAREIWHIGAGGAITSQSTDEAEWEEMVAKRAAVLRLFTEEEEEAVEDVRDRQ